MKTNPHDPVSPSEKMSGMNTGITLREHFSAMAMQGILSDQTFLQPNQYNEIADYSVQCADALIEALNK